MGKKIWTKSKPKTDTAASSGKERKKGLTIGKKYGTPAENFHVNSLYESDAAEEHYGEEQMNPLFRGKEAEQQKETNDKIEPKVNLLHFIGGMPDVRSIDIMAGGLKLDKLKKHKHFGKALTALEEYQAIMSAPRSTTVNEEKMRRKILYTRGTGDIKIDRAAVRNACMKMSDFIHHAEKAVEDANGFFAARSSNVQKLTPVFSNLLVQASGILPKLGHLESAVPPYIILTGREQYTFSEIMNHKVMGAHEGGLSLKGMGENNGAITYSPDRIREAAESIRGDEDEDVLQSLREEQTKKARMGMLVPVLPVGILREEKGKALSEGQKKKRLRDAAKIVEQYLAELRMLMTALDDTAESHEFSKETERQGVQEKDAEYFRVSRLFYRAMQQKELLEKLILQGMPDKGIEGILGYEDIEQLCSIGGMSLAEATALINEQAMNPEKFARLTDSDGNELQAGEDYRVGGGNASISILDFKNRRVLRAPKNGGKYTSKQEQMTALNGIKDEAAGKVSQFLGFQVCAQAEAVGFKARDAEGKNETAVFGGSIMEMANGVEGKKINLLMKASDKSKIAARRNTEEYQNLEITKNGRLVEDIMKMNALDFLIQHNDRNPGNFLVNVNAGENESVVTAIDNDMTLGFDNHIHIGGRRSDEALLAINERAKLDFGIKLNAVLPMMTQEMKDKLGGMNIDAFEQLLMPYTDRLTRMTAVHRARELKAWAEQAPVCDLTTPDGVQEFIRATAKESAVGWIKQMNLASGGASSRELPSTLLRMVFDTYGINAQYGTEKDTLYGLKILGFTRAEAEEMLLEHMSSSDERDERITREQLEKSELGRLLNNYDAIGA